MANTGQMTTNSAPRLLQLGVDTIIKHLAKTYKGKGAELFKAESKKKAFIEAVYMAGMGYAAVKGEGSEIAVDSYDQHLNYVWPTITYGKAARITEEAIEYNLYEDQIPILGREIAKSMLHTKDFVMATVWNNLFSTTSTPDGVAPISASHPLQAGGTTSNILSPAMSFGEDALEQLITIVDNLVNPDGLPSDYTPMDLVTHTALRFEVARVLGNPDRPGTADRDINVINHQGIIRKAHFWKRLSDTNAFFLTTDAEDGFVITQTMPMKTTVEKAPGTNGDILAYAREAYVAHLKDFRAVAGSAGAT